MIVGGAYLLGGLHRTGAVWDNFHPRFGQPDTVAVKYGGCIVMTRTWHAFEVYYEGHEAGVIFMNDGDLAKIEVREL